MFCTCLVNTFAMLFGDLLKCHLARYCIHPIFIGGFTYVNRIEIITYYICFYITFHIISTYKKNIVVSVFSWTLLKK